jgi:hypothetical protein
VDVEFAFDAYFHSTISDPRCALLAELAEGPD